MDAGVIVETEYKMYKLCQKSANYAKLPYKGSFFVTFMTRD